MGSLTTELGKGEHTFKKHAREMMDVFADWLGEQFRGAGRLDDADELAKRLLARAQGVTVLAHIYDDPAYIAKESSEIKRWLVDEMRHTTN